MYCCFEKPIKYFYNFFRQPENKNNDNSVVKFLNDTNFILQNKPIDRIEKPKPRCGCMLL